MKNVEIRTKKDTLRIYKMTSFCMNTIYRKMNENNCYTDGFNPII